jgi:hypothetical protein
MTNTEKEMNNEFLLLRMMYLETGLFQLNIWQNEKGATKKIAPARYTIR